MIFKKSNWCPFMWNINLLLSLHKKMKFSIQDFLSKWRNHNGKLHFLCSVRCNIPLRTFSVFALKINCFVYRNLTILLRNDYYTKDALRELNKNELIDKHCRDNEKCVCDFSFGNSALREISTICLRVLWVLWKFKVCV